MTPDELAFRRAIIASPEDDLPRLVYADHLDELGEADRAEFIRVQCRIAELGEGEPDCNRFNDNHGCECDECTRWYNVEALRRREEKLWKLVNGQFTRDPSAVFNLAPEFYVRGITAKVTRGFIDTLRGPLTAFWEERECRRCRGDTIIRVTDPSVGLTRYSAEARCPDCGPTGRVSGPTAALVELARREPVRSISLTGKTPDDSANTITTWSWWASEDADAPDGLPSSLFALLPGDALSDWGEWRKSYSTEAEAIAAPGTALIRAARARVLAGA